MHFLHLLTTLAALLLGALVGGRLAALLRLPRVTGYLLAGLILGPSLTDLLHLPRLLHPEALHELEVLTNIALALILLNIGGQFRTDQLRRFKQRILLFSFAETFGTFALVALATFAVNQLILQHQVAGLPLGETSLIFALLLGLIAIATAPAATLMVVREYEAEGPVTGTVLTLVGLNNLIAILSFAVADQLLLAGGTWQSLLIQMFGPIVAGGLLGLALSVWAQRLELESEYKLLLLGGAVATSALCQALHLDMLLASLALGVVLANSSPRWHRLQEALRQIDYPLYVAFFVLAGAQLHLTTLGHIGLLGVAYVLARAAGKLLGAWWGAWMGRFGPREKKYIGCTLLAQAGVAIGLAEQVANQWPEGGHLIETVVLGAVVIFELVGPLAVRHGLVKAGEVPILSLLQKRAPQGAIEGFHSVIDHFRTSLGLPAGHRVSDPGDILVRHVMRQNVETLRNSAPFNEILKYISHSRYDRFPVVDEQGHFVGMINYTEIRNLLFEPALASLVIASDLVSASHLDLGPDQPLRDVLQVLQQHRDISYFPVVDPADGNRLLGILRQNDVFAAFRRLSSE